MLINKLADKEMTQIAQQVLITEANTISSLINTLDENFIHAVNLILATKGHVIVTGMGKPGYIAHKLAATFMSTGTPAFYLHPAEAIHGDLGSITKQDMLIAISHSGETVEILNILPTIKKIGIPVIAICGNHKSTLAHFASCVLPVPIAREACPLNLAPTSSTTAQLALGDALAVTVMTVKGFTAQDFAFYHPGGHLGQVRLMTVKQLIEKQPPQKKQNSYITADKSVANAIFVMTESGIGAVAVVDNQHKLLGIITDGDIRRQLQIHPDLLSKQVSDIMITTPTVIEEMRYVADAIKLMEQHKPHPITVLPVVDEQNHLQGMVHITDLHH